MGCHIETPQSGPWKGSTLIMCGEAFDPPKPCKFCGDAGLYLCDWKEVVRIEDTHWHDVRVGDTWVVLPTEHYRVAEIRAEEKGLKFILVGKGKVLTPFRFFNSTLSCPILRGTCDQPVCERHAREVGDDVHYCMDCWQRQAAMIGGAR
jgi:hypothetical protein